LLEGIPILYISILTEIALESQSLYFSDNISSVICFTPKRTLLVPICLTFLLHQTESTLTHYPNDRVGINIKANNNFFIF